MFPRWKERPNDQERQALVSVVQSNSRIMSALDNSIVHGFRCIHIIFVRHFSWARLSSFFCSTRAPTTMLPRNVAHQDSIKVAIVGQLTPIRGV